MTADHTHDHEVTGYDLEEHLNAEHGYRLNDLMGTGWDEKKRLHDEAHSTEEIVVTYSTNSFLVREPGEDPRAFAVRVAKDAWATAMSPESMPPILTVEFATKGYSVDIDLNEEGTD